MGYKRLTCPVCQGEFQPSGAKQETCSRACGQRLRVEKAGKLPGMRRVCEVCGVIYRYSYSKQRTCGRACGVKIHTVSEAAAEVRRQAIEARRTWPTCRVYFPECVECGTRFTAQNPKAKVCKGAACRRARQEISWAKDKRRPPPDFVRRCGCGVEVARNRRKCDVCLALKRKEQRKRGKQRRRARLLHIAVEHYTIGEIAERDRFKCGLLSSQGEHEPRRAEPQGADRRPRPSDSSRWRRHPRERATRSLLVQRE